MRATRNWLAIDLVRRCGQRLELRRQRLFIGAVRHTDRCEHRIVQQLGERLIYSIDHRLLHDRDSATRVVPLGSGLRLDADCWSIRRPLSIQHLHQRWNRLVSRVPGKAVNGSASGMREQLSQRYGLAFCFGRVRQLPASQLCVDVRIQRELPFLHQLQSSQRSYGLTDRTRLEQRVGSNRRTTETRHAEPLSPLDNAMMDDCDTYAGHMVLLHALLNTMPRMRIAFDD